MIERDQDGDGFGDATQDGCPESPVYHGPCPVLSFSPQVKIGEHSILVRVRSTLRALVVVEGLRKELGASFGTRKTIPPNRFVSFRLKYTPVTERLLRQTPPSQRLPYRFVARVADVRGSVKSVGHDQMVVKFPGRG